MHRNGIVASQPLREQEVTSMSGIQGEHHKSQIKNQVLKNIRQRIQKLEQIWKSYHTLVPEF